jgi:hypothetical protein
LDEQTDDFGFEVTELRGGLGLGLAAFAGAGWTQGGHDEVNHTKTVDLFNRK